ncbi:Crp/Fnr family transcriptional regulator [Gymnodinialimonas hymeniacidonis]|uniref:Crp/Fnr family transcriptional regulator n=1 Tax=Gymnodinialimonas hymeniacidonis TaxID=3126508 RepID=UPI0034C69B48
MIDTARYADFGQMITAPDGACLFQPGDESSAFLIVTNGHVRVEQTNAEGRTMVLYRVHEGESCVMTTSCLLGARPYSGYGYAEGSVQALAIGAGAFHRLMAEDADFRDLVFEGFSQRLGELTDVIDALLLHRTDLRLAAWLAARGEGICEMTQQDIAREIGTAREVVSRTLKSFEREGWLVLGRGRLEVIDPVALHAHAKSHAM